MSKNETNNESPKVDVSTETSTADVIPEIPLVGRHGELTVRDDQYDFAWMLDAVKRCRKKGARFRLVDSGELDRFQLEWLLAAGADFYSSDEARSNVEELVGLRLASGSGRSDMAMFGYRSWDSSAESEGLSESDWISLGRDGVYLHFSNRDYARDPKSLRILAESCLDGGSRLVYYHHGPLKTELMEVADGGGWIHLSDRDFDEEQQRLLPDILASARKAGGNLVFYIERGLDLNLVAEMVRAKAHVVFSMHHDFKSPFKPLERAALKRKLSSRYYYLYPRFLL